MGDTRTPAERLQDLVIRKGGWMSRTEAEQAVLELLGAVSGPIKLQQQYCIFEEEIERYPEVLDHHSDRLSKGAWMSALEQRVVPFELPRVTRTKKKDQMSLFLDAQELRVELRGYRVAPEEEKSDGQAPQQKEGEEGRPDVIG